MKDWLFYPVMALIAGAMIYVALYWGGGPQPINPEEGYVVQGTELQFLTKSPGTNSELNGLNYAVMSASFRPDQQPSQGVYTTLDATYAKAYEGRKIELVLRARAGQENPTDKIQIAFLTVPPVKGRFGWRDHTVEAEFSDIRIPVNLGEFDVSDPVIYFGIWPDPEGKGRTVEVEKILVKPVKP